MYDVYLYRVKHGSGSARPYTFTFPSTCRRTSPSQMNTIFLCKYFTCHGSLRKKVTRQAFSPSFFKKRLRSILRFKPKTLPWAKYANAVVKHTPLTKPDWQCDVEKLEELITPKTKLVNIPYSVGPNWLLPSQTPPQHQSYPSGLLQSKYDTMVSFSCFKSLSVRRECSTQSKRCFWISLSRHIHYCFIFKAGDLNSLAAIR